MLLRRTLNSSVDCFVFVLSVSFSLFVSFSLLVAASSTDLNRRLVVMV